MSNDTIYRQAAIDAMEESKRIYVDRRVIIGKMQDIVSNLPSAQPLTARAISDEDGNLKCSNCGSSECWGNYCMNCGAKMGGDA